MKKLLILILLGFSSSAFAQRDTVIIYTDQLLKPVSAEAAFFIFKTYKKDKDSYVFAIYDKNKLIRQEGTYSDSLLRNMHGAYVEFTNGKPSLKGNYVHNKREGDFTSYDSLGHRTAVDFYHLDSLKGTTKTFWPNGNKRYEKFVNDNDRVRENITYYDNGKLAIREKYTLDKLTDSIYLDPNGHVTSRNKIETQPQYPGGIDKFYMMIGRNIRYPADAAANRIQGTVYLSFTITENGIVEGIKVDGKLYPSLDNEAVRVLKLSAKWTPGIFLGKPTSVLWNIPIKFSLSR